MSDISSSSWESPITALRDLFLSHVPPIHARMTEPSYDAKYLRVQAPITDADLAAHLAGDHTLACVFQRDELAQVAACDIDVGGEAMVRRVLRAAETRACHAYGFMLDSGEHSGGHIWIFFARPHPARDLQVLMRDIVTEAQCRTTEIYPSHADLRLPFGLHRRCKRRGSLLLNSAAPPLDLDADLPGALATFLASVRRTSDLPVRVAREAQETRGEVMAAIATARPRRVDPDAHWREVIAQFNATTNLVTLLEGYGARAAYHYAGGKVLMHCAASQDHAHGDKHASLVVEMGRGHQTGRMICGCYCPACRLHNQPGQVMDAFEVYCRLEGISKREAVARLQRGERVREVPRSAPQHAASPVAAPVAATANGTEGVPDARTLPVRVQVTPDERAVQQRLVEVNADARVQPLDRRLLAYLISHGAHGHGLANAALAAALGAQPDSIKRAKRRLRTLGYIEVTVSHDGIMPSVIRLLGVPESTAPETSDGGAQRESELAPPSHVESEITCDAQTREGESSHVSGQVAEGTGKRQRRSLGEQPIPELRRRQGVLRGLLRRGGTARQQLAWQAEIADIQVVLDGCLSLQATFSSQSQLFSGEVSSTEPQVSSVYRLQLAYAEDPHPALSDQQLTSLLRDALEAKGDATLRPLLGRVSWKLTDEMVTVVCSPYDLQVAIGSLRTATWLALTGILPGRVFSVTVRVGQPEPVACRPAWLVELLWMRVPQWLRPLLVGSVLVDQCVYGATPERTAGLADARETIQWLLGEVAAYREVISFVGDQETPSANIVAMS